MDMTQRDLRLTADDWADAALDALAAGGLQAVAVEPLARRLGVTKGSFYWHFRNRDALIEAAMRRWEERGTTEIIEAIEAEVDPVEKPRRLLETVIELGSTHRIELALQASAGHPLVAPALARIAQRRVDYVAELFEAAGVPPEQARHRAIIGVSIYHGFTQLAHTAPGVVPDTPEERRALVRAALAGLLDTRVPRSPPRP